MASRRHVSSNLSVALVDWMVEARGFSQERIAELLEVTPGFVSRVRKRERGFTLEHFERISEELKIPLGALLMAVVPIKKVDPEYSDLVTLAESILKQGDRVRAALDSPVAVKR